MITRTATDLRPWGYPDVVFAWQPLMRGVATAAVAVGLTLGGAAASLAAADDPVPGPPGPTATARASSLPVGYDVSWPQCARVLPTDPAFAIVGVNNGLANTTNPCLAEQLAWAWAWTATGTGTGTADQPRVALYVNTANPGLLGSWWPESNAYPESSTIQVANPYGVCEGDVDAACAYMYGYAKAYDDATIRGVPDPAGYVWWLDVETMNSWEGDATSNRAVLEGMTYYFLNVLKAQGVGIYSTTYQWRSIVGSVGPVTSATLVPRPSTLNYLPSWLAGATSLAGAQRACRSLPLTGGDVALVQYVQDDLDHNYACPA